MESCCVLFGPLKPPHQPFIFFPLTFKFDTQKPVHLVHSRSQTTNLTSTISFIMSEAPAAPVTENGVPPAAQENVNETPEFKVRAILPLLRL